MGIVQSAQVIDRRETKQKHAIRGTFETTDRPLSPEEVLELARLHVENIGIATVYRGIKALVKAGWLDAVDVPGEPARYEIAGKAHHHHFHCQICGRVFELAACINLQGIVTPPSFKVLSHHLTVLGHCQTCNKKPVKSARQKKSRK